MIQPRKPIAFACFNGAAFSRTRKRVEAGDDDEVVVASMGPRSHERGNGSKSWSLTPCATCFNGAAFSRTRKLLTLPASFISTLRSLQWGRVLTNAETRSSPGSTVQALRRFNGAAFSRTRKPVVV